MQVGPRFELRIYQIKLGTMDQQEVPLPPPLASPLPGALRMRANSPHDDSAEKISTSTSPQAEVEWALRPYMRSGKKRRL